MMVIKGLYLCEDNSIPSKRTFSEKTNLIWSESNSKGKTTFVRLLFYALGYRIPETKGMKFADVKAAVIFEEKGVLYKVERKPDSLKVLRNETPFVFVLPDEHILFLKMVFQTENEEVLRNLLGIIYIDQDKGWSLLNRGTVIGSIRFSIEELVAGLADRDVNPLEEKEERLKARKKKYESIQDVQKRIEVAFEENGDFFSPVLGEEITKKISFLDMQIRENKQKINELSDVIRQQKSFFSYISQMRLYVRNGDGEAIPVNSETIEGASDNSAYLNARIDYLASEGRRLRQEKQKYEQSLFDLQKKEDQLSGIIPDDAERESRLSRTAAAFAALSQEDVAVLIDDVDRELAEVRREKRDYVRKNGAHYISQIYAKVRNYAARLNILDKIDGKEDFIFTRDLKVYSGSILSKICFAFKLAFLKVMEEKLNTKLFFVLDSPASKEFDQSNVDLLDGLLREELSENQVFIASVVRGWSAGKTIQLANRAIEEESSEDNCNLFDGWL